MNEKANQYHVPFKTPVDYFTEILGSDYDAIDWFQTLLEEKRWKGYDCDLHVYPYTLAQPAMLSTGCPNQCPFCPSAQVHKGKIKFGNFDFILSQYKNKTLHFIDENFFYNKMGNILPLLKKYEITWLVMSDYKSTKEVFETFGEEFLFECGLRVVEMGLENVALYKKVQEKIPARKISIYYLNMTCLSGETKESIVENTKWMKTVSLRRPIHFNNGVWYACGQFFHPYQPIDGGRWLKGKLARVKPTWIPNTLLEQNYEIVDLESANYYSQLVYGIKIYNPKPYGSIGEFIGTNQQRAAWLLNGLRVEAIK